MTTEDNFLNLNTRNIFNNINKLQKDLETIIKPYAKTIDSILPPERDIESTLLYDDIEIEALYDRFSGWEGTISKKSIRDWLEQFESILDKNIAYLLIEKLQFFSKSDIETATQRLQSKLLNILKDRKTLRQAFYSDPKVRVHNEAEMEKWFRNKVIRYARFPSPSHTCVESQDRLWGIYERSALTETSSSDDKKLRPLKEYFEAEVDNVNNSVFVFMDYTNGSGNQLRKCVKEINKLLKEYPTYQNSIFIFMYVVQSEFFSFSNIHCLAPNSQTIFYEQMLHYKNQDIMSLLSYYQITEAEYNDFIATYCFRSSGKVDAGYHQSGSLTCHHYSCPNNTLPFFHKRSENWTPLFRDSQTPNATRYRQK